MVYPYCFEYIILTAFFGVKEVISGPLIINIVLIIYTG